MCAADAQGSVGSFIMWVAASCRYCCTKSLWLCKECCALCTTHLHVLESVLLALMALWAACSSEQLVKHLALLLLSAQRHRRDCYHHFTRTDSSCSGVMAGRGLAHGQVRS
jgi:hypothetical protein